MLEKLKADVADIIKLTVGTFVGAVSVALQGDLSAPALKAAVAAAGVAAVRVGLAALAAKLAK